MVEGILGLKAHGWEQSWQVSGAERAPVRLDMRTVLGDAAPNYGGPLGHCAFSQGRRRVLRGLTCILSRSLGFCVKGSL